MASEHKSGWPLRSLSSCATYQEGYVNPSQGVPGYFGDDVRWLRAVDLNDSFVHETSRRLSFAGFSSAGKAAKLFRPGSLAISKSGTIGRLGILQAEMCGNRAVINIEPHPDIDTRFLFYSLLANRERIIQMADGSVQKNLYVSQLGIIELHVPPLGAQRAIAETLGSLDDKIEQNRRTGAKLEGLARAVFKAWFVDFEPVKAKAAGGTGFQPVMGGKQRQDAAATFPGMPPETFAALPTRLEDSELGPVPQGWEVKPLSEVVKLTMGQSPKSEFYNEEGRGLPFHQGVTDYGFRFPSDRVYCTAEGRIAESGDILLSVRAPVGRINVADRRLMLGRGLAGMRHLNDQQSFLLYQMFHVFAEEDAIGDGTIYKAVNKDFLSAMPLIAPPKQMRNAFEAVVRPMDELIVAAEKESAKLATLRDYLLPRLLSGRVRVRGEIT